VDVTNTGSRDGDEVVQLYVRHVGSKVARPQEELRGFERVQQRQQLVDIMADAVRASATPDQQ